MRDEWYVARRGQDGNKRYGPVPLHQLRELVDSGKVRGDDLVWRDGMGDWQAADQCPDLAAPARPSRRAIPFPTAAAATAMTLARADLGLTATARIGGHTHGSRRPGSSPS